MKRELTPNLWEQGSRPQNGKGHEILFGHVQEDTSLEASLAFGKNALCIASGGETAFDLLLGGAKDVVAVDVNPSQLLLVRLKYAMFRHLPSAEINTAFTTDASDAYRKVKSHLPREVVDYFDSHPKLLSAGLINAGKIDVKLRKAMQLFQMLVQPRKKIHKLIEQPTIGDQADYFAANWKGLRMKVGLRLAFNPTTLKSIFGSHFGSLAPKDFGQQVLRDLESVLTTVPLEDNPYVQHTFLGSYSEDAMPAWLTEFGHRRMAQVISRLGLELGDATEWMARQPEPVIGLACLSNILDASTKDEKVRLIQSLSHVMIPGGYVVARSLFDVPIGLDILSNDQLERVAVSDWVDRSLICRNVEVYRWQPS